MSERKKEYKAPKLQGPLRNYSYTQRRKAAYVKAVATKIYYSNGGQTLPGLVKFPTCHVELLLCS